MQTCTTSFQHQVYDAARPWQHLLDAFDLLESVMLSILIMTDDANISTRNKIVSWWRKVLEHHVHTLEAQPHDDLYDLSCRVFCTHSIHTRHELGEGGDEYASKMQDDLLFYEQLLTV